jgi:4'-phosphopantetheinyl transferase
VDALTIPRRGECHLWTVPARPRPEWAEILDGQERARLSGLEVAEAGRQYLTSRALQRIIGAHYLGTAPDRVVVVRTCEHCGDARHGRPRFAESDIDYSVSHTRDWVRVAVVSAGGRVGVDLEESAGLRDVDRMARCAMGERERADFARAPAARRPELFLRAWTRKEAAMKLLGLGLRLNPARVDVRGMKAEITGAFPGRRELQVHLRDLPAPRGHVSALASGTPLTRILDVTGCGTRTSPYLTFVH